MAKFRHECKHRIAPLDCALLRSRLKAVAQYDPFAGENGIYHIRSLYFDNLFDKALREKLDGVNGREKFRLRYYNQDLSFIRLEKKSKINGLCQKEGVTVTAEQCEQLLHGEYRWLLESGEPLLQEFYSKLRCQGLRAKNIVDYTREAYAYPAGNVRITIDSNLRGSMNWGGFLSPDLPTIPLGEEIVLEVKYDEFFPQLLCDMTRIPNRRLSAFSKYAAARIY